MYSVYTIVAKDTGRLLFRKTKDMWECGFVYKGLVNLMKDIKYLENNNPDFYRDPKNQIWLSFYVSKRKDLLHLYFLEKESYIQAMDCEFCWRHLFDFPEEVDDSVHRVFDDVKIAYELMKFIK